MNGPADCVRRPETAGSDLWTRARWAESPEEGRLRRARKEGPQFVASDDWFRWPWIPRACPHCGGVHPEDALQLVREGWAAAFGRADKAVLHPPGYGGGQGWTPVPPVKAYLAHFTVDGWKALHGV